jgi:hypothetical protein
MLSLGLVTLRDDLNKKKRWSGVALLLAFLSFGGTAALASKYQGVFVGLPLLSFLGFGGAMLYQVFGVRCRRCRAAIGRALNGTGCLFSVPPDFRFCPYCGRDLDTDIDIAGQT